MLPGRGFGGPRARRGLGESLNELEGLFRLTSYIIESEGARGFSIYISKAIFGGKACRNQHRASLLHDVRIASKSGDCSANELRRLRIGQVEPCGRLHNLFCPDETRIERNHGDVVRA